MHELAKTLPLIGILVASLAGAVFVTAVQLLIAYAAGVQHVSPLRIGIWTWPQLATLLVAAVAFYFLIRTRWLAPFVLTGFVVLTAGTFLLVYLGHLGTRGLVLATTALLGFGAGATVSPALWMAGFSVSAKLVGRVFALGAAHGIRHAAAITVIISLASVVLCVGVWVAGRRRFEKPDLERYVEDGEPAL